MSDYYWRYDYLKIMSQTIAPFQAPSVGERTASVQCKHFLSLCGAQSLSAHRGASCAETNSLVARPQTGLQPPAGRLAERVLALRRCLEQLRQLRHDHRHRLLRSVHLEGRKMKRKRGRRLAEMFQRTIETVSTLGKTQFKLQ